MTIVMEVLLRFVRWNLVRQRHVPARSEATNIGAVLVLDPEQSPQTTTADLRKTDDEREDCRVLKFLIEYCIEDPVESQDRVQDHGGVVNPGPFVAQDIAKEGMRGIWIEETCSCQSRKREASRTLNAYSNPWQRPKQLDGVSPGFTQHKDAGTYKCKQN